MEKITAERFFKTWKNIVLVRKESLLNAWQHNVEFTSLIKGRSDSVLVNVAHHLDLLCYNSDYYSIDAIFYKEEDRIFNSNPNSFWFKRIRIAFEHENNFRSGLYQEVSHLLITNCDLKVLVTYPIDEEEKDELAHLHKIISSSGHSDFISENENFLIIFGYENGFEWKANVYKTQDWKGL